MPEIFNTSSDESPQGLVNFAQRVGGRSESRIVLEGLEPGQAVVYGPDEPAHIHRGAKQYCPIQELVGRVNRRTPAKRLKSEHNADGQIFVVCFERGKYRGN
jgi:hypothetical protein